MGVATSGLYERGTHIRDPHTGRVPGGLRSLTVIGPTLAIADAYATAAFAMGFGAVGITAADRLAWTPLAQELLDLDPDAAVGAR